MYFLNSHKSHAKKYRLKNIKEIYINMTAHRNIFFLIHKNQGIPQNMIHDWTLTCYFKKSLGRGAGWCWRVAKETTLWLSLNFLNVLENMFYHVLSEHFAFNPSFISYEQRCLMTQLPFVKQIQQVCGGYTFTLLCDLYTQAVVHGHCFSQFYLNLLSICQLRQLFHQHPSYLHAKSL